MLITLKLRNWHGKEQLIIYENNISMGESCPTRLAGDSASPQGTRREKSRLAVSKEFSG
jgi:hypothetical protein